MQTLLKRFEARVSLRIRRFSESHSGEFPAEPACAGAAASGLLLPVEPTPLDVIWPASAMAASARRTTSISDEPALISMASLPIPRGRPRYMQHPVFGKCDRRMVDIRLDPLPQNQPWSVVGRRFVCKQCGVAGSVHIVPNWHDRAGHVVPFTKDWKTDVRGNF
jgi:hypothetical protein